MKRRTGAGPNSGTSSGTLSGTLSVTGAGLLQRVVIGVLLVLLIALQVRLWTGKGSLAEVAELEQRLEVRRAENRRQIEHNAILEAEVRALKEDPDSLEARARSELGMIRDGETFFMVVPRAGTGGPQAPRPVVDGPGDP